MNQDRPDRPSILVIDDDPLIQRMLVAPLERRGYRVQSANSLAKAEDLLANAVPTAAIVDVFLGDGLGFGLVTALRQAGCGRVIMYSRSCDQAMRDRAAAAGAHAIIEKTALGADAILPLLDPAVGTPPKREEPTHISANVRALLTRLARLRLTLNSCHALDSNLAQAMLRDWHQVMHDVAAHHRGLVMELAEAAGRWGKEIETHGEYPGGDIHGTLYRTLQVLEDLIILPDVPVGAGTVVVVDDDPMVLRHARAALTRVGYAVSDCIDAIKALDVLREVKPVLLITDLMMPGMSGLRFIREVRQDAAFARLPILVVSAMNPGGDGALDLLPKPINARELAVRALAAIGAMAAMR